jgi:restriction endonuclease S subunit
MKLGEYSTVRTGLVFSRKQAPKNKKSHIYRALNLRNITENGYVLTDGVEDYQAVEPLKDEYFTHDGDVLLRLSAPYTSALITEKESGLLVPSHFAIIRVNRKVIPAYLHWWLMSNRKLFYKVASGTSMMGTISSGYVSDMEFELLPLKLQKQISELLILANNEQRLLMLLTEKKKKLVNSVLTDLINKNKENK